MQYNIHYSLKTFQYCYANKYMSPEAANIIQIKFIVLCYPFTGM